MEKQHRTYDPSLKNTAIRFVLQHPSYSIKAIANKFGINDRTLATWMRNARGEKVFMQRRRGIERGGDQKMRECLMCHKEFLSESVGNRVCMTCKPSQNHFHEPALRVWQAGA